MGQETRQKRRAKKYHFCCTPQNSMKHITVLYTYNEILLFVAKHTDIYLPYFSVSSTHPYRVARAPKPLFYWRLFKMCIITDVSNHPTRSALLLWEFAATSHSVPFTKFAINLLSSRERPPFGSTHACGILTVERQHHSAKEPFKKPEFEPTKEFVLWNYGQQLSTEGGNNG